MGLSLVMQSAYLQANIPQSLPFICCGISFKGKDTKTQTSFFPRKAVRAFQLLRLKSSKGRAALKQFRTARMGERQHPGRGDEDERVGSRNRGGAGAPLPQQHLPTSRGGRGGQAAAKQPATEDLGFVHPLESPRELVRRENQPGKAQPGPKTKARTKCEPFSEAPTAQTHLAFLTQQRPAVSVKLLPFLVKTFLF